MNIDLDNTLLNEVSKVKIEKLDKYKNNLSNGKI